MQKDIEGNLGQKKKNLTRFLKCSLEKMPQWSSPYRKSIF